MSSIKSGLAAALLLLAVGCQEDPVMSKGDAGTDADSDTDTDSGTGSVCDDPLYGYETECTLPDDPCPCDLFCSQEHLDAMGSTSSFASFYCYQTCDEVQTDESCPGEYDICYFDQIVQHHLCLVEGQFESEAWELVIVPDGEDATSYDYSPINASMTLGEHSVTFDEVVGFEISSANLIIVNFLGSDSGGTDWLMQLKFPAGDWAEYTFGAWPFGAMSGTQPHPWFNGFIARMEATTGYNEAAPSGGEIEITEANPPGSCTNPPDCVKSHGAAFEIDLVGMMFEQPYN